MPISYRVLYTGIMSKRLSLKSGGVALSGSPANIKACILYVVKFGN